MTARSPRPASTASRLLAPAALILAACTAPAAPPGPYDTDAPFVVVPRPTGAESTSTLRDALTTDGVPVTDGDTYYLAINKKELGNRWFLSAYLKTLLPGEVSYGAARSLGTRVVSFQVHNDKLYVLDASDGKKTSDAFDPILIVDAWPLVHDPAITAFDPKHNFVFFDPAAGLNRFGVVADDFSSFGERFQVELSFAHEARALPDGVTYEEVFTGYGDLADPSAPYQGENNLFRSSGTLGIGLRRYAEGVGFTAPGEPSANYFFRGDINLIPNTGATISPITKWNIHPGMKPIQWVISPSLLETQKLYPAYDLLAAVKAGIENWNQAFGFKVLAASLAAPGASFADDSLNYLIWDRDPSVGFAFANERTNPNTGEIRGASVYMNPIWVDDADQYFADDPNPPNALKQQARPKSHRIQWDGMKGVPQCNLLPPRYRGDDGSAAIKPAPGGGHLTKKQKVEAFLTHVVLHEVGHTLGLRHNFKGSLVPDASPLPSTSVMDYLLNTDSVPMNQPGPYDIDAIHYLYGLSVQEPAQGFCTDEDTAFDPNCNYFDRSDDPLRKFDAKYYAAYVNAFFKTGNTFYLLYWDYWMNEVLSFVRGGDSPAARQAALAIALEPVLAPVDPNVVAQSPDMGSMIDLVAQLILRRLYVDPPSLRDNIGVNPPDDMNLAIMPQLSAILVNQDAIRSYPTRRLCVDILKQLQTFEAYQALLTARQTIAVARLNLAGPDASLTDDLLSRIDRATMPYFN